MKKNKSKLIIGIIIVLIIALIMAVGAYLYFTTDLFKGEQQLFFKYLAKNGETIKEFLVNNELDIEKTKHNTEAEITFNVESRDAQIANQSIPAENFNVKYLAKVDPENNKKLSETTLKYLTTDLFTLKYIRNNDLYALKSDEVINKYLAIDNNNLKEFATKLGVQDTSMIPNKLQPINFKELFSITEEQQKALFKKYLGIINTQISKDKYKSQKNVTITVKDKSINVTAYSLEITQDEAVRVLKSILNELKNDDATLNIFIDKIKTIDNENGINLNDLKDILQNAINSLENMVISNEETIKITVYASDGKLVRTEIAVGNEIIYIDSEENDNSERIIITFENKDEVLQDVGNNSNNNENNLYGIVNIGFKVKKVELAKQLQNNQETKITIVTFEMGDEKITVSTQSKTEIGDNIKNNTIINLNISDNTFITSKINTTKTQVNDIDIEELTKENSATINDFTSQYIANLSQAIINRIQTLFTQKVKLINEQMNFPNSIDNSNRDINTQFQNEM